MLMLSLDAARMVMLPPRAPVGLQLSSAARRSSSLSVVSEGAKELCGRIIGIDGSYVSVVKSHATSGSH